MTTPTRSRPLLSGRARRTADALAISQRNTSHLAACNALAVRKALVVSVALASFAALAACRHVQIPYDLGAIEPLSRPAHARSIAILPLRDERVGDDRDDSRWFTYRGEELFGTVLDDLAGDPMDRITELLAQHLHRAAVFERVELVRRPEDAGPVDLLLEGAVTRLRGYVEALDEDRVERARPVGSVGPKPRRLAEVVLRRVRVREAHPPRRILFDADVGWSIDERTMAHAQQPPSDRQPSNEQQPPSERWRLNEGSSAAAEPWATLASAMFVAFDNLARELKEADLSGGFVVRPRVELDCDLRTSASPDVAIGALGAGPVDRASSIAAHEREIAVPRAPPTDEPGSMASARRAIDALSARGPAGWTFVRTSSASSPVGWRSASRCLTAAFVARQTLRFHRVLGPYRPEVRLWACPSDFRAEYDARVDYSADYLGRGIGAWHYFILGLGETNWPTAAEDLARCLDVEPSARRHVFSIGPDEDDPSASSTRSHRAKGRGLSSVRTPMSPR